MLRFLSQYISLPRRQWQYFDWPLFLGVLGVTAFGMATLWGTTHHVERLAYLPQRQAIWWAFGLVVLTATLAIEPRLLKQLAPILYAVALSMLIYLLLRGTPIKGARSWFFLPGGMRFQPAEVAKIATVLMLAKSLVTRRLEEMDFVATLKYLTLVGIITGTPFLLIAAQPDLGTAIVFLPMTFITLFAAGLRWKYILIGFAIVALVAVSAYPLLKPYQKQRLTIHFNPESDPRDKGYNIIQAKIAIGSGQVLGKGLGNGTQSHFGFLPEHQTDFIFNSLGEQLGFLGCFALLAAYFFLFWRGLRLALLARDYFGAYTGIGLLSIFGGHVFLNTLIAVQILPVTGLPLPFFSSGGSFLATNYFIFGMVLNIGMRRHHFSD